MIEVPVRGGDHSTAWIRKEWIDDLAMLYPTVDVTDCAKTLARKAAAGSYTPPTARGLRRALAAFCETAHRYSAGKPNGNGGGNGRAKRDDVGINAGAEHGYPWSESDLERFGGTPDWEAYVDHYYGLGLNQWPPYETWAKKTNRWKQTR